MPREPRVRRLTVSLPVGEGAASGWLRNVRFSGFSLLVLVILVLFVVVLAPSLRTLVQQQQQVAALEAEVAEQGNSVDELQGDVARWSDPAYVEAQARDRLLYVYPGEYSYLVSGDDETVDTGTGVPVSDQLQTPQVDWVQAMTSSLFEAGLSDETATELVAPDIGGEAPGTTTDDEATP